MGNYEPKGTRFFDNDSGREMLLVAEDEQQEGWRGWLFYKHPDGQWVSLRKATDNDIMAINQAMSTAFHKEGNDNGEV